MKAYGYCLMLCVCLGVSLRAYGEQDMKENRNPIPKIASLNVAERVKLVDQLTKEHGALQDELIAQLDASKPKEIIFQVAYLLGVYRMEGAVSPLSKFIQLEANVQKTSREALWDRYPIVEALIRIGNPAVPEMLKSIETSQDKEVRKLSARVIKYVMGQDIAKIVLERAMENKPDKIKANFQEAIKSLDGADKSNE